MKKILIVSTVSRQFYLFEQSNIEVLKSIGYEIHGAANFEDASERLDALDIIRHPFDIQRSPFSLKNIKAYKQLKKIMKSEKFDVVHCHSPMGSFLARLAANSVGVSSVIYTAHGFHFYQGAPLINWLVYYTVEKWLSRYTDILITINKEDYKRAKKFGCCRVEYIPGIGISTNNYIKNRKVNRDKIRMELNIDDDSFVVLSVGELNKNKNHESIIKAISKIPNRNIIYFICGKGKLEKYLSNMIDELGLGKQIKLLGFRNDIHKIYQAVDLFALPSFREGLSVALMEAMAYGLPVIASKIRGNTDLLEYENKFLLFNSNDIEQISRLIVSLYHDENLRNNLSMINSVNIKKFDKAVVKDMMYKIYKELYEID